MATTPTDPQQPQWPGVWHEPPAQPAHAGRDRRPRKLLAGLAATALAAGLVGGSAGAVATYEATRSQSTAPASAPALGQSTATGQAGSVAQVAASASASVVKITVTTQDAQEIGSGVILSSDGKILTNNHVISDAANGGAITVTFADGSSTTAVVLGAKPGNDLAVIQAQGRSGLKAASFGDSSSVTVGQTVVAIGSPEGLQGTVTAGIVSATGRKVSVGSDTPGLRGNRMPFGFGGGTTDQQSVTISDAIQTDASINPGNSGGPLLNLRGQVIGVNFAITSGSSGGGQGGSVGLGFTIPINDAKTFAAKYVTGGSLTS